MQHLDHLLLVYAAYIIAVASPGPSNMAIMGVAMSQGRKPGLMLAFGVITGSLSWAALAATGLSAVLATYAHALFVIKIAGGLYLLYLAFKSARSAMAHQPAKAMVATDVTVPDYRALYRRGLLCTSPIRKPCSAGLPSCRSAFSLERMHRPSPLSLSAAVFSALPSFAAMPCCFQPLRPSASISAADGISKALWRCFSDLQVSGCCSAALDTAFPDR